MENQEKAQKRPKAAVITRTKDRPLFLERAIESAQKQTMKDFVQVVLNDGGDQEVVEKIVKKQQQNHPERIKLIHNKKPAGHSRALNQAIRELNSEYVAILDDDDTWHPNYLKKTTEYLDKTHGKGVVTAMDRVIEKINEDKIEFISKDRWRSDIKAVSLYGQCMDNYAPTVAFVYSRDVYEELGGYDEELGVAEDWEFTLRFLLKYDIDFLNTEEALAYYHHRPDAKGSVGNSVFAGRSEHDYYLNKIANYHLREDLRQGKLGLGYIINNLKYQRENELLAEKKELQREEVQTVRLEGHINYTTEQAMNTLRREMPDMVKNNSFSGRLANKIKKQSKN